MELISHSEAPLGAHSGQTKFRQQGPTGLVINFKDPLGSLTTKV